MIYMEEKPRISLGPEHAKKFYGYAPGETCTLTLRVRVYSVGQDSVSLEVLSCEMENDTPRNVPEAARRAKNELYVRNRIEPNVG